MKESSRKDANAPPYRILKKTKTRPLTVFSTPGTPPPATATIPAASSGPAATKNSGSSGSRSSLVSSVTDDSGLGNGSPVPPEKPAQEKPAQKPKVSG